MTAAHESADVEVQLAEFGAIEAVHPGFIRALAPGLKAAFERRLLKRTERISRVWRPRDPRVRAALEAAAADTRGSRAWDAAKRGAIHAALFEYHHRTAATIETALLAGEMALWLAPLPDADRPVIALAEESLHGEAPLGAVDAERRRRARRSAVMLSRRSPVPVVQPNLDSLPADLGDPLDALMVDEHRTQDTFVDSLLDHLVNREEEYLDLLTKRVLERIETGQPLERLAEMDEEIAEEMGVATVTVRVYRSTITKKAAGLRQAAPD